MEQKKRSEGRITKVTGKKVIQIILSNSNRPLSIQELATKLDPSNVASLKQKLHRSIIPYLMKHNYFTYITKKSQTRYYNIDFDKVPNGKYYEQSKYHSPDFTSCNSLEEYIVEYHAPLKVRETWSMILSCNGCRYNKIVKGNEYGFECPSCGSDRATVVPNVHNANTFYEQVEMEATKLIEGSGIADIISEGLPKAINDFKKSESSIFDKMQLDYNNMKRAKEPHQVEATMNVAKKQLSKFNRQLKHNDNLSALNLTIGDEHKEILKQIFADNPETFEKVA